MAKQLTLIILLLCLVVFAIGCTGQNHPTVTSLPDSPSVTLSSEIASHPPDKLYGLDFSPYKDGQDPDYGATVNDTQLRERMRIIAPHTVWIRTYGSSNGLERSGSVGHSLGLKVAAGAWLSKDLAANERELNALIAEAKAGNVDLAIVGSETLYRGDLNETQLIDYVQRVKAAVPGIQVTTADTYGELKARPNVVAACDVAMINYYPYFEGISIDGAMPAMDSVYQDMANRSGGKTVIISETGWPSAGDTIGRAVPSSENSSRYLADFVAWSKANNVSYFYFEAFDETWKVKREGPQGAHWGIWDKDGKLKPGMCI